MFETTSQSFPPSFEVFHAVYFQRPYRTKLNISGVFPTTLQNKAEHFSETVRTEFFFYEKPLKRGIVWSLCI